MRARRVTPAVAVPPRPLVAEVLTPSRALQVAPVDRDTTGDADEGNAKRMPSPARRLVIELPAGVSVDQVEEVVLLEVSQAD